MSFVTSATWCSDANGARKLVSVSVRSIVSMLWVLLTLRSSARTATVGQVRGTRQGVVKRRVKPIVQRPAFDALLTSAAPGHDVSGLSNRRRIKSGSGHRAALFLAG